MRVQFMARNRAGRTYLVVLENSASLRKYFLHSICYDQGRLSKFGLDSSTVSEGRGFNESESI